MLGIAQRSNGMYRLPPKKSFFSVRELSKSASLFILPQASELITNSPVLSPPNENSTTVSQQNMSQEILCTPSRSPRLASPTETRMAIVVQPNTSEEFVPVLSKSPKLMTPPMRSPESLSPLARSPSPTPESPTMASLPEISSVMWNPPATNPSISSPREKSWSELSSSMTSSPFIRSPSPHVNCYGISGEPLVKAATSLCQDSSTEIIDVFRMSHSEPHYQCTEVADYAGRLCCVDRRINNSCWLEIISIANDCASCNVILMSTENGIMLKVIKQITPGEPLLMWFAESVLAMLEMPYLTNSNIQENRYVCHMCRLEFDHPNPLKIHLKLHCRESIEGHLWTHLANVMKATPHSFVNNLDFLRTPLNYKLAWSPRSPPERLSPVEKKRMKTEEPLEEPLGSDANQSGGSSSSSNQSTSSISPCESSSLSNRTLPFAAVSPPMLPPTPTSTYGTPASPTKRDIAHRQSAFKPYASKCRPLPQSPDKPLFAPYHAHPPCAGAIVRPDAQAAHVEALVSNLGKSSEGHQCLYCGKMYSRKYGLKIHIRTHTGYKPLKCKYCFRPFGDPSNLNKHVRLHAEGDASRH